MANQYLFLPWLRRGMAKAIAEPDLLTDAAVADARAKVKLNVQIFADEAVGATVPQEVSLIGPGDITGIDRSAIVKTDPAAGVTNFEPNFFPYIEFYEEDFLWRYTPGKSANETRLRPWLSLVVLEEQEFQRKQSNARQGAQFIQIEAHGISTLLPDLEQSWAWAHIQINGVAPESINLDNAAERNEKVAAILNNNPNLGVSRLLCPRKLKFNTKYFAFVVPAFEKGRLAGLGAKQEEIDAISRFKSSWSKNQTESVNLPVYHEWNFRTGEEDFEVLAKKITPQELTGTEVGRLWMDVSNINYGSSFDYTGNLQSNKPETEGFLPFDGALVLPREKPEPNPKVDPISLLNRVGETEKDFVKRLAGLINLGVQYRFTQKSNLQWSVAIPGNDQDDPLLVPPIYGKWYANSNGSSTVDPQKTNSWLEQLNLDPSTRIAAGLGAEVVRENQEDYVSRAWEQLSSNRRSLNRELHRLRFAEEVTTATYKKHFTQGGAVEGAYVNKLLALTQSLHTVVKSNEAGFSIAGKLTDFKPDTAFVQPTFRRLTRSSGPIFKRVKTAKAYEAAMVPPKTSFFFFRFAVNMSPPFQNFNCSDLLAKIDPQAFGGRLRIRGVAQLQIPNWFGDSGGSTGISSFGFPAVLKELQGTAMRKPVFTRVDPPNLAILSAQMQARVLPSHSFKIRFQSKLPAASSAAVLESEVITPNSFNPFYSDSTYEPLRDLRPELFIPNLDLVNPNSFVLLQANDAFIESYLVGMNHELASEFLWRGYPADLNATFFRRFWDTADSAPSQLDKSDIDFIRKWNPTQRLGGNGPAGKFPNPLVFVIKAELVKKYPNLVVYAQKAKLTNNNKNRVPDTSKDPILPVFLSNLTPDYLFAGFPLSKGDVISADGGYYFVIAERPGEMHFGLDQTRKNGYNSWNDLAWTDLNQVTSYIDLQRDIPVDPQTKNSLEWGKGEQPVSTNPLGGTGDAAQIAAILNQKPVRIFVHASQLVK